MGQDGDDTVPVTVNLRRDHYETALRISNAQGGGVERLCNHLIHTQLNSAEIVDAIEGGGTTSYD